MSINSTSSCRPSKSSLLNLEIQFRACRSEMLCSSPRLDVRWLCTVRQSHTDFAVALSCIPHSSWSGESNVELPRQHGGYKQDLGPSMSNHISFQPTLELSLSIATMHILSVVQQALLYATVLAIPSPNAEPRDLDLRHNTHLGIMRRSGHPLQRLNRGSSPAYYECTGSCVNADVQYSKNWAGAVLSEDTVSITTACGAAGAASACE